MDTNQIEQSPQTNGMSDIDEEEKAKMRPVDIDADVREMERRKRVEMIMNSKLFREELERIIESQLKDGSGPSGLLQQISDMVGVNKQGGNVFKSSNCVIPVNDIRGIEAMGYAKGEKILRCKLGCLYRLIDLYGWAYGSSTLITARLNQDDEQFLVNPYGLLFHEVTASSLIKVDMQGTVIEQGTTNFSVNITAYSLHAAVHSARPDIKCIIHVHTPAVVAVSSLKQGLMPLSQEAVVIGEVSSHFYLGGHIDHEEKDKLARNLGPINKVVLLSNQGALCCGETIEEAFFNARNTVLASEIQLKLMPVGIENLVLINEEVRKTIYDTAHKAPESSPRPDQPSILEGKVERKWRVGGAEFEALMRMLDNAGFRTGYIYRHPLVKGEPPKPKNDVEVPPAVSSLGYLLEEEELYRQGLWRKLEGGKKGHDRSRWLNSPNTYQKVEILETGTPDPKKITKWVAEGSPSHSSSTAVKIESALQFVPTGTNPKEFKKRQQQIKDYRRADKISAGPQSHILEGVTWEEAKKMQDATVTQTGDHVVLMGAASKGIIQRGHQHNAMVYKSPYAKNPFDNVTDDEINEYKMVVEKKTKGEYDTDYSESEGLSSAALNKRLADTHIRSPTSVTSETEEESHNEPQILRIETKMVPKASQPEVVLSDGFKFQNRRQYRTYSHAGLPKGSYLEPKPYHFHICRKNEITFSRHIEFSPASQNPSSRVFIRKEAYLKAPVTVNFKNSNSISVNIPVHTTSRFVTSYTTTWNIENMPIFNNQESQTSYMNNINYTPLHVETCSNSSSETNSFERRILNQMKQQLLNNFSDSSDSESEYENADSHHDNSKNSSVVQFDEYDQESNDCLLELTPEIAAITISSDSSPNPSEKDNKSDIHDLLLLTKDEGFGSQVKRMKSVNVLSDTSDSEVDETKQILHVSFDEGIDDTTVIIEPFLDGNSLQITNEGIKELSDLLMEYLIKQCFEVKELILFPEILHDPNFNKLLEKLKEIYNNYFGEHLSEVQKNELRVSIAKDVLHRLEHEEKLNSSGESDSSNTISDKMFTITELLNDILDDFFDLLGNEHILPNFQNIDTEYNTIFHSTPESVKKKVNAHEKTEEISSFHQKTLSPSGSELYWISITASPSNSKKIHASSGIRKKLFHVNNSNFHSPQIFDDKVLSPIPEESTINQSSTVFENQELNSFLPNESDDFADRVKLLSPNHDLNSSVENESGDFANKLVLLSPIPEEPRINLFNSVLREQDLNSIIQSQNGQSRVHSSKNKEDAVLKENICNNSEICEPSVIFSNNVNFCRTHTTDTNYLNKKTAFFRTGCDNKENEELNNSGNWLGYEAAKF